MTLSTKSKELYSVIFPITIILITINLPRETQIFTSLFPRKFLINILRSFLLCIININSHIITVITFIVISCKLTYRFFKVTISTVVNFQILTLRVLYTYSNFSEKYALSAFKVKSVNLTNQKATIWTLTWPREGGRCTKI